MAVVVIQSIAPGAGGGDISLSAIDWADVTPSDNSGISTSQSKTIADISSPVVLRAEWTSTSSSPTKAQWIRNGTAVQVPALTPIEAAVIVGQTLEWDTYAAYTHPSGNYDTGTVTVTNRTQSGTCTMTIASPCVVSKTGHQLAASMKVRFSTTGALPTGIAAGTIYYVIAGGLTADAFEISATDGGAAINTSGSQSGVHTVEVVVDTFAFTTRYVVTGSPPSGGYDEPPIYQVP